MSKKDLNYRSIDDPLELYAIIETLGEGSYGKVFKATKKEDGVTYAIKVVHVEDDISEVEKEINFLKKLRSEHITQYYDSFLHPSQNDLWIIIEYCGGGSVCDVINVLQRTLNQDELSAVVAATLKGLVYLHRQRKIHRDIKAGNILLTDSGAIKLGDFGVSAQLTNSISKRNTVIGTPYWMAPEVIQETSYDHKADIWSLGITILEMSEGRPPLANVHPMRAIFMIPNKPPPTFQHPDNWSPELVDFLAQCLVKDPEARPDGDQLLGHPFVRAAKSTGILQPLVESMQGKFQEFGGRDGYFAFMKEKEREQNGSGSSGSSGSSSSGSSSGSDSSDDDYGTVRMSKSVNYYSDSSSGSSSSGSGSGRGSDSYSSSSSSDGDDSDSTMRPVSRKKPSSGTTRKKPTHKRQSTTVVNDDDFSDDSDFSLSSSDGEGAGGRHGSGFDSGSGSGSGSGFDTSSSEDDGGTVVKHSTIPKQVEARRKSDAAQLTEAKKTINDDEVDPESAATLAALKPMDRKEVDRLMRHFRDCDLEDLETQLASIESARDEKIAKVKQSFERRRKALEIVRQRKG